MKRRDFLTALAATPVVAGLPGFAFSISADLYPTMTAFLSEMIADEQFNGSVTAIYRKGKPDFFDIRGTMDGEKLVPMKRDAIFALASMTKPITSVACLILVEQGKLKLDDPVEKWLPELANRKVLRTPDGPIEDTVPSPRSITVADLLSFRCGYGSNGARGPFQQAQRAAGTFDLNAIDGNSFLKALSTIPLQYAPGEHWLYDVPADIMGVLIARVTGKSFGEFLKANIFAPLKMHDTAFFVPKEKQSRVAQFPTGKAFLTPPEASPRFESGGHGLTSTVDDYMRFAKMLLNKGTFDGVRILKPKTVESMSVDRLKPEEHKEGGFFTRYPGRGFGYMVAVRTEELPVGPSVGAYNWAGATGVWFVIDPARELIIVTMVQHPQGGPAGPPPGTPGNPGSPLPTPANAKKYLSQTEWNDAFQKAVYTDIVNKS